MINEIKRKNIGLTNQGLLKLIDNAKKNKHYDKAEKLQLINKLLLELERFYECYENVSYCNDYFFIGDYRKIYIVKSYAEVEKEYKYIIDYKEAEENYFDEYTELMNDRARELNCYI